MSIQFIDVIHAFTQFDSLFRRNGTVNSSLNNIDRSFAAFVNKWHHIELFTGMIKYVLCNGSG